MKTLLLILAVTSAYFSLYINSTKTEKHEVAPIINVQEHLEPTAQSLTGIKAMLHREASTLHSAVIDKVATSLECADEYHVAHNKILTVIDYSLPSSEKRLWVFDLQANKLLYNTYVSHGIKSGALLTNSFSNKYNSKESSIGVYKTDKAYYGREGLSLKLEGLDRGFNDNAANRSVVMHSGWYMDEQFIKKYGRAGRSWGCPALPIALANAVINTIKEDSLLIIYYPSDSWFTKSKYLNCKNLATAQKSPLKTEITSPEDPRDQREAILYVDLNKNNKHEENEPVVVVSADDYAKLFMTKPPLARMLRRQINHEEYIVLSNAELASMVASGAQNNFNYISFVIPKIVMSHGYFETQMQVVNLGKIREIRLNTGLAHNASENNEGLLIESNRFVKLNSTSQFIRWVGL